MAVVDKMYACFGRGDMETIKNEVFAPDIQWTLPGHNPLSGVKHGADEVLAFFGALMAVGVNVDNVSFGTIGDDRVVETHSGHGTVEGQDYLFPTCSVYTIRDGKIWRRTSKTGQEVSIPIHADLAQLLAAAPTHNVVTIAATPTAHRGQRADSTRRSSRRSRSCKKKVWSALALRLTACATPPARY